MISSILSKKQKGEEMYLLLSYRYCFDKLTIL